MRYEIRQAADGVHRRHDRESAATAIPSAAELEFWFRIEELQIEIERLKNWLGKIGHEAWKGSSHALLEAMATKAIQHASCAAHTDWGTSQEWAALGVWPPRTPEELQRLFDNPYE